MENLLFLGVPILKHITDYIDIVISNSTSYQGRFDIVCCVSTGNIVKMFKLLKMWCFFSSVVYIRNVT